MVKTDQGWATVTVLDCTPQVRHDNFGDLLHLLSGQRDLAKIVRVCVGAQGGVIQDGIIQGGIIVGRGRQRLRVRFDHVPVAGGGGQLIERRSSEEMQADAIQQDIQCGRICYRHRYSQCGGCNGRY
ncbi:LysR family transcriptional regulator [Bradyrhizobium oligotrophicum S58]|uniref:LysR family transcriptional regulator n=1 Tax=Bradyrhizobium oligotrophicum S58 TaxID=1245469 RepID=M4Z3V1_9BRAD|nr:LysR family transcriptional regulator [Bradyrhizobium oligotrophicum S58]